MRFVITCAGVVWLTAVAASGQTVDTSDARTGELAHRQQLTKRQFDELTAEMLALAEELSDTEPDSAEILREAVQRARGAYAISQDMDKVVEYLRKGMTELASRHEGRVIEKLKRLLRLLREGVTDADKRLESIRKWQKLRDDIDDLIDDQAALERISDLHKRAGEIDEHVGKLDKQIAALIAAQKALRDKTGTLENADTAAGTLAKLRDRVDELLAHHQAVARETAVVGGRELPVVGRKQGELAEAAAELSKAVTNAAARPEVKASLADAADGREALDDAAGKTAAGGETMQRAAEALGSGLRQDAGASQASAADDLRAARAALTRAMKAAAADTPAGKIAGEQDALAGRTRKASDASKTADVARDSDAPDLSGAAQEMDRAADKLNAQDPDAACKHQDEALKHLEDERERLAELHRRVKKALDRKLAEQKPQQDALAHRAGKTAGKMSEGDAAGPGQKSMKQAAGAMGKAGKQLGKSNAGGANARQKEALDAMKQARDALDEAIDDSREMMQAETLARVDRMLDVILRKQKSVSAETAGIHARRGEEGYGRPDQVALGELGNRQGALAGEIEHIAKMLAAEGTTVVFPAILGEVRADMTDASTRLTDRRAGPITQGMQAGIEQALRQMIDAIRKEFADRVKAGGGGAGAGGAGGGRRGKAPLIPRVAELKLLLALQQDVNRRTGVLARQVKGGDVSDAQAAEAHEKLAARQKKVEKMTRDIAKSMQLGQSVDEGPLP
ncbi:MAG: hypothetical protein KGY99_03545 [Phycisphaerae bacterium]|nr:hypothetical protein [Phycisphaerae bacterium]